MLLVCSVCVSMVLSNFISYIFSEMSSSESGSDVEEKKPVQKKIKKVKGTKKAVSKKVFTISLEADILVFVSSTCTVTVVVSVFSYLIVSVFPGEGSEA